MRRLLFLLIMIVWSVNLVWADDGLSLPVNDSSATIRLENWRSLAKDADGIRTNPDRLMRLLPYGLKDENEEIRDLATAIAAATAYTNYNAARKEIFTDPKIVDLLIRLASEKNTKIRKNALYAIGAGVKPDQSLEEKLLTLYPNEQDASCRELLLTILERCGNNSAPADELEPSTKVIELITRELDNSSSTVRGAAARAIVCMKNPPLEALPRLIDHLDPSDDYPCQFVVAAVGHYGKLARAHLPRLEQMRTDVKAIEGAGGEVLRFNLNKAIQSIQNDSQQATSAGKSEK